MSAGDDRARRGWHRRSLRAPALLVALLHAGASASGQPVCSDTWTIEQLQGRYEIVGVEKFRGGLTSREEAERGIGLHVAVLADRFRLGDDAIDRPAYELACHPVATAEGEIDPDRWSNFYGFRTDRRVIEVLEVHDPGGSDNPRYRFEVIGAGELWRTYDGWLFRLTKTGR